MTNKTLIALSLGAALVIVPLAAFAATPDLESPTAPSDFDVHVEWMEANWDAMNTAMESGDWAAMAGLMDTAPGMEGSMMGSGMGAMMMGSESMGMDSGDMGMDDWSDMGMDSGDMGMDDWSDMGMDSGDMGMDDWSDMGMDSGDMGMGSAGMGMGSSGMSGMGMGR